jgi:hypothetical protein
MEWQARETWKVPAAVLEVAEVGAVLTDCKEYPPSFSLYEGGNAEWSTNRVFGVLQWCLEGAEGAEVEALVKGIPDVENFAAKLYKGPQAIVEEGPRKRNRVLEHL